MKKILLLGLIAGLLIVCSAFDAYNIAK